MARGAPKFQEKYIEADGFRIRYREAGPAQAMGTVVMLDGISWGIYQLHDALAQQYRVVAIELPGFGNSPANTRSRSVKDLASTVAQAAAQLATEKYTLIGSSLGANVALWQALQAPEAVEALVLISPTAIQPAGDPVSGTPSQFLAYPEKSADLPPRDSAIAAQEQALVHRLGGATHDGEVEQRLGEIQCPTLAVFGSRDRLVSPQAARVYREKVPNCHVSLVYDAGHLIVGERPEALVNVVADFVERRETFIVGRQNTMINP